MLLTDPKSSSIEVKIVRAGQSGTITFTNGEAVIPNVEAKISEPGIGYIAVPAITGGKAAEVSAAIAQLTSKGAKKIVLDLRGAALGPLEEGAAMANLFIEDGVLARKVGRGGTDAGVISAKKDAVVFRGPLTVLVDESTAGAGEVVAAAVESSKRGEVVGERTWGAGVELGVFNLRDGGAMLITVAKYAPPQGKPFMEEGVTPTVEVKQQTAEVTVPEDRDGDDGPPPSGSEPKTAPKPAPKPVEDLQLKKAIEVLKGSQAAAAKAA